MMSLSSSPTLSNPQTAIKSNLPINSYLSKELLQFSKSHCCILKSNEKSGPVSNTFLWIFHTRKLHFLKFHMDTASCVTFFVCWMSADLLVCSPIIWHLPSVAYSFKWFFPHSFLVIRHTEHNTKKGTFFFQTQSSTSF